MSSQRSTKRSQKLLNKSAQSECNYLNSNNRITNKSLKGRATVPKNAMLGQTANVDAFRQAANDLKRIRTQENVNCPRSIAAPQLTPYLNKVRSANRIQSIMGTPKYNAGFAVPESVKKGKGQQTTGPGTQSAIIDFSTPISTASTCLTRGTSASKKSTTTISNNFFSLCQNLG